MTTSFLFFMCFSSLELVWGLDRCVEMVMLDLYPVGILEGTLSGMVGGVADGGGVRGFPSPFPFFIYLFSRHLLGLFCS